MSVGLMQITTVLFMIVMYVVIPVTLVWLLVQFFTRKNSKDKSIDNMTIGFAKERYAKGEISKAEFEEIKQNLASL